jgi:hypothetical protein
MDQGMLIPESSGALINLIWVANGERGRRAGKKNRKIVFIRHIKFRKNNCTYIEDACMWVQSLKLKYIYLQFVSAY